MTAQQPSARLLEFLNRVDDQEFTARFHAHPQEVMKEYGLSEVEVEAITRADVFKGSEPEDQRSGVRSMLKTMGLNPDEHADLVEKLAINYDPAW
ncbi:hypothetical protein [Polyangium aurulentum]|uniref:hypothetical protein n=1 Tax=Polyangium aurulentum TaxID=2567896 RepID=UPI0010AE49E4|nr:hypothetical protein [Polyangium aurulentum]UQA57518.1 hypothetical protein E8A73_040585 [Polyangium aurulentum]